MSGVWRLAFGDKRQGMKCFVRQFGSRRDHDGEPEGFSCGDAGHDSGSSREGIFRPDILSAIVLQIAQNQRDKEKGENSLLATRASSYIRLPMATICFLPRLRHRKHRRHTLPGTPLQPPGPLLSNSSIPHRQQTSLNHQSRSRQDFIRPRRNKMCRLLRVFY